jgi:hypothetical protein
MAKTYNRIEFLKFAQSRTSKHRGFEKTAGNYLTQKFVTAQTVHSVLARLSQFNYALMGGFALGFHGYQRATSDIDIMVNGKDIPAIAQMLGLQHLRPLTIGGMAGTLPEGTEVDLVAPTWPWVPAALQAAQSTPNGKVLSKPFMVIAKLWAARGTVDDMDVLQLVKLMAPAERKMTRSLVRKYLPNDVEDFDQMVMWADVDIPKSQPKKDSPKIEPTPSQQINRVASK